MVKIEDLQRINLLKHIPDHLFEIIAKEAQLSIFGEGTQLITVNENIDTFYMLIMGQVAVKKELTPEMDVILDNIQSGSSFGVPALLRESKAFYTAVCQEPCEVISLSGKRMKQLFRENQALGYHIMYAAAKHYKKSMEKQILMIMKTLDQNPMLVESMNDIKKFLPAV